MENFFAVLHVLIAVVLVLIILIQDPKGGSAGLFGGGGGGSNSLFGATGTPTLLSKATRYLGIAFAATCIGLSLESCQEGSVTDRALELAVPAPTESAPTEAPPAESAPAPAADTQE